jgi:hypothetical protein
VQELTQQRKLEMKRVLRKVVRFIDNQLLYPRDFVFFSAVGVNCFGIQPVIPITGC